MKPHRYSTTAGVLRSNKALSSPDSSLGMHISFGALISPPPTPQPVNHTFVSSLPSDWLVPLMPSFKVLTFIHSWLPNDNEERITCNTVDVWERHSERGKERKRKHTCCMSEYQTTEAQEALEVEVENGDQTQRSLWIFLYASLSILT